MIVLGSVVVLQKHPVTQYHSKKNMVFPQSKDLVSKQNEIRKIQKKCKCDTLLFIENE